MRKTLITWMLVLLSVMLMTSCVDNTNSEPTYKVGGQGPAGGIIFYDVDADNASDNPDGLIAYDCGWRYLEGAKNDATYNASDSIAWSNQGVASGLGTAIGTGKTNTLQLLEEKKKSTTGLTYPAAEACDAFGDTTDFDDWFLPSKDELNLMYINLQKTRRIIGSNTYWSSSEYDGDTAWKQYFWDGSQSNAARGNANDVRPIRRF